MIRLLVSDNDWNKILKYINFVSYKKILKPKFKI